MMTEKLLQFIWKNRYFSQNNLELFTGEKLIIENTGVLNSDQGPDFINARIRINNRIWIGNVELHLFTSGWDKHKHSEDPNFRNVILHVVWKQDCNAVSNTLPLLELCEKVPVSMLETYSGWMKRSFFIPCENAASTTKTEILENWGSSLLIARLNRRMYHVLNSLEKNQFHWEEQLWWMIAAQFGGFVNQRAFESVARSLPVSTISKHRMQFIQLEALCMGQANLLEGTFHDPYPAMLKKEFLFLKKKYGLMKVYDPVQFLRMRPEGFPTIRFSQLAALYADGISLSWILECENLPDLHKKLRTGASDYWHRHYVFGKPSPFREKIVGSYAGFQIIINAIIPMLYTYGKTLPDHRILKKSIEWLSQIPAENNQLISGWNQIGVHAKMATGSQALTELKKQFCDQKKCLECDIGKQLLLSESSTMYL